MSTKPVKVKKSKKTTNSKIESKLFTTSVFVNDNDKSDQKPTSKSKFKSKSTSKSESIPSTSDLTDSDDCDEKRIATLNQWVLDGKLLYWMPNKITTSLNNTKIKICGLDFDNTLITTKSGHIYADDEHDYMAVFPHKTILNTLKEYKKAGYHIVLFSNQSNISRGQHTREQVQFRFTNGLKLFDSEIMNYTQIFIATHKDDYHRKPFPGMWEAFKDLNNILESDIDMDKSFYVGDAAGRIKTTQYKKDFASSDRSFAHNCGLNFYIPEEFFKIKNDSRTWSWTYQPKNGTQSFKDIVDRLPIKELASKEEPVMIMMIGYPGSGKSTLSSMLQNAFEHTMIVNRDTLKSMPKCVKETETILSQGYNVIIDNTNPTKKDREKFIEIAKKKKIKHLIAINIDYDRDTAMYLCNYRFHITRGTHTVIPGVAHNLYRSRYESPSLREGFSDVIFYSPRLDPRIFEYHF